MKKSEKTKKRIALINKIKRSNKSFKTMSPAQKRVRICKDVIELLEAKQIRAKFEYGYIPLLIEMDVFPSSHNYKEVCSLDARDKFKELESCTVCALGSLMYSHVCRTNNITLKSLSILNGSAIKNKLKGIFTPDQLSLIESAFEKEGCGHYDKFCSWESEYPKKAVEFGARYKMDNNRLIGIMKNIITNKGTFKP